MRGISFTATRRGRVTDKPVPHSNMHPNHVSHSSSKRLFKRLSTHFRRPEHHITAPTGRVGSDLHVKQYQSGNTSSNGMTARALTFTAGETARKQENIPFFEEALMADPTTTKNGVAKVAGKPAWMKKQPVPVIPDALASDKKPVPNGVLSEVNRGLANSFTVAEKRGTDKRKMAIRAKSMTTEIDPLVKVSIDLEKPKKVLAGRRWPLPMGEDGKAAGVRLFTPQQKESSFSKISARRDRTEARVLVSSCTFLEEEIERLDKAVKGDAQDIKSTINKSTANLKAVLRMLEERYEKIEKVYEKTEEYAIAMGKFFEVPPQVIDHLAAGHKDLAGNLEKDTFEKRKSLR